MFTTPHWNNWAKPFDPGSSSKMHQSYYTIKLKLEWCIVSRTCMHPPYQTLLNLKQICCISTHVASKLPTRNSFLHTVYMTYDEGGMKTKTTRGKPCLGGSGQEIILRNAMSYVIYEVGRLRACLFFLTLC